MLFTELNDKTTQNLGHISIIYVDGNDVVYQGAKGSNSDYREHFDSNTEAQERFDKLKEDLLTD